MSQSFDPRPLSRPLLRPLPRSARAGAVRRAAAALLLNNASLMAPAVLAAIAMVSATPARAVAVGDSIFNPSAGAFEVVTAVLSASTAQTNSGALILFVQTVGQEFVANDNFTYRVTAVTTADFGGTPRVVSVQLTRLSDNVVSNQGVVLGTAGGAPGTGASPIDFGTAAGNVNVIIDARRGTNGGNGSLGAVFVPAGDGGDGANGPSFTRDVGAGTTTAAVPLGQVGGVPAGIYIASIGGNGGRGGDSAANLAGGGGDGGDAGDGGAVTANIAAGRTVITSGTQLYGIFVQSAAGVGGVGGDADATTGGGGAGGAAGVGGPVTLNSLATVDTTGVGAHGIVVQSVGGSGGAGGDSFLSISGGGAGQTG